MMNDRSEDTPTSMSDFYYLNTTKQLNIEAWRPRQPNAKNPDQCLVTYLGLEPNASWCVLYFMINQPSFIFRYDFACEQTDWQWAMCTACFLPVTFTTENSYVIARGLCSRTKFDTQFEVTFYISLVQRHVHVDFNM